MEAPAEAFELLLPQAVAVACRRLGVVAGAVALDREDEAAGLVAVGGDEVDAVAADSVLGDDGDAGGEEAVADVDLEGVELRVLLRAAAEVVAAGLDVGEVAAEELDAAAAGARGSMSSALNVETSVRRRRARVIATFSLRSPFSVRIGPKWYVSCPLALRLP